MATVTRALNCNIKKSFASSVSRWIGLCIAFSKFSARQVQIHTTALRTQVFLINGLEQIHFSPTLLRNIYISSESGLKQLKAQHHVTIQVSPVMLWSYPITTGKKNGQDVILLLPQVKALVIVTLFAFLSHQVCIPLQFYSLSCEKTQANKTILVILRRIPSQLPRVVR